MTWEVYFFSICNLILPILMIAIGILIRKVPPKTVNKFYGYRTKRSMRDEKSWLVAHRFYAVWVSTYGSLSLLFAIGVSFFLRNELPEVLARVSLYVMAIELVFLFLPILHTESMLKRFATESEME
ncbi:MAG: SdpI family protein [Bacillota bacterium]